VDLSSKSEILENIFRLFVSRISRVSCDHDVSACDAEAYSDCYMTLNLALNDPFGSIFFSRFLHVYETFAFTCIGFSFMSLHIMQVERKESDGLPQHFSTTLIAINENFLAIRQTRVLA